MTDRRPRARAVVTCVALACGWAWGQEAPPRFADATATAGIDFRNLSGAPAAEKGWATEAIGAGVAWLDYDGDGHLDLYLVNGSTHERKPDAGEPNRLFRGDGKGKFTDVTASSGAGHRGWGYGVAVGDIDNDGDADLYVTNNGPNVLYRNNGDGTFRDVTAAAGVGDPSWSTGAAFFDMDDDGDLDLYVGNYMEGDHRKVPRKAAPDANMVHCGYRGISVYCGPLGQTPYQDVLYRNDGDGKFTDVTRESGLWLEKPRFTLGVVSADLDNDGRQDLYVANDSVRNSLWRNNGNGKFTDRGVAWLAALNSDGRAQAGMGTDAGDYNGDGFLDLVVTNFSHDLNTIYRNAEGRFFVDDSVRAGMGVTNMALSWAAGFHDFDHDSDLDLFIANGHVYPEVDQHDVGTSYRQSNHLFLNNGRGKLIESSAAAGPGFAVQRSFRGAAFADYDRDGDVDIIVTALDEAPLLLRNEGPTRGHYLELDLEGRKANRDAIGARVVATIGERRLIRERKGGGSFLSASAPTLHFGLGSAKKIDRLEVRWPGGKAQILTDVAVDRRIRLVEGETPKP